jgi:hypothetical protein
VVKAARELELPIAYIACLESWLPTGRRAAGHRKLEEFG